MIRSWMLIAVALLFLPAGSAQARLGIGYYAPEVSLYPYQQFGFIQGLAQHLSRTLGLEVKGYAYKKGVDLRQDQKRKKVQLAVLGGFFLAARPKSRILATSKLTPKLSARWSLMGRQQASLASLRGKVLQVPRLGKIAFGLVENGLLGGNLAIKKHFKVTPSPGLVSAQEAARLGKAHAVFAPVTSKGLVPLVTSSLSVPPPAFVLLDPAMPAEQVKKVTEAVLSHKDRSGAILGWHGASPLIYRRFAARARKRPLRMMMVPSRGSSRPRTSELVNSDAMKLELPPLDELFKVP
jgi:hypothetical protein